MGGVERTLRRRDSQEKRFLAAASQFKRVLCIPLVVFAVLAPAGCEDDDENAPAAPANVAASPGDTQITISWDLVTGADSYSLYWSNTSGVTKSSGTQIAHVTTPFTHTGLTNGTTYYYVVTTVDAGGESAESEEVTASPQQPSPGTVVISGSITYALWSAGDYLVWAMANGQFTSPIVSVSVTGATSGTYSLTVADDAGTIMLVFFNDVNGNDDYDTNEAIEFACDIAITADQDVTRDFSNLDPGNFTGTPCQGA